MYFFVFKTFLSITYICITIGHTPNPSIIGFSRGF
jgi:hypothetical protein